MKVLGGLHSVPFLQNQPQYNVLWLARAIMIKYGKTCMKSEIDLCNRLFFFKKSE